MTDQDQFNALLEWRCIGPFRGGRVVAVAGSYDDPNVFYFGAAAGGVWKTYDAGTYWECVSDSFFHTASIGALAVAPSDSNVIYAGTGESTIRIDVSHGDGVYKSTDAGKTWAHIGLEDTRHIGKIRVHPDNPDVVYVAALGHAFGRNEERGVYKSTDGGATWRKVLYVSDKAGAVDLSLDPANPRIIYAAIWEAYRNFWQISSGGPDCGIWQSTDGGETWTNITDRPGLPKGTKGKIAVAASPAQSGRVWALIEHKTEGGLYRSDDAGVTWEKVSDNQNLVSRAWYYIHLTADPQDADTIYVNNLSFWKSTDGGRNFFEIDTQHGDDHDLWIDPRNNQRMIQSNDGGAHVSLNGGASWSTIYNQPTAQFYHLATDSRHPYYVYGTQQDNTSIAVPSRTHDTAINWNDCFIAGTGESGYIVVHPENPNIVYVGAIGSSPGGGNCLQRYDHSTGQLRLITTWPESMRGYGAEADKYRFAWTYPIIISPHDPNTIYIGGNLVFKTTNEGQTWEPISPDLTRADPETLKPSGGPVNRDAVGAEIYATVFSLVKSPHEQGVLWAGSDDGLLHISRDGGQHWSNITPADWPEWMLISGIELSPLDKATAYVAGTRYKLDDYQPYLYKTTDYGQTWQRINDGISANDFTRVIRTDPARQGLLYAGTETRLYISFDNGASWQPFQSNLPIAPMHEILVRGNDLIVGTHGRSIWILDNLSVVHQMSDQVTSGAAYLFKPQATMRPLGMIDWTGNVPGKNYFGHTGGAFLSTKTPEGEPTRKFLDIGENPPQGAMIAYYLKDAPQEPITLSFKDGQGNVIHSFSSKQADEPVEDAPKVSELSVTETPPTEGTGEVTPATATMPAGEDKTPKVPAKAGWNRFVWNLRYAPAPKVEGTDPAAEVEFEGPVVPPGTYQVTLTVGDQSFDQSFEVVKDAGITTSNEDLQKQFELRKRVYDKLSETVTAINRMRDLRQQLDGWNKRTSELPNGKSVATAAAALRDKVLEIEKTLLVPDLRPGWGDTGNHGVRLLAQLSELSPLLELGEYAPTDSAYSVFEYLSGKIDAQIQQFQQLIDTELAQLNRTIAESQFGAILPR